MYGLASWCGIGAQEGEREQHAGEDDEEQRDAVDAEVPGDPPLLDPGVEGRELEAGVAGLEAGQERHGERQLGHGEGHGHRADQLAAATGAAAR